MISTRWRGISLCMSKFYRGPTEALNGNAVRGIRADRLDDGGISGFKTERIRGQNSPPSRTLKLD
jgi:hypothetical protein